MRAWYKALSWVYLTGFLCQCTAGSVQIFDTDGERFTNSKLHNNPNCKRGVAYNAGSLRDFQTLGDAITWHYNWSAQENGNIVSSPLIASRFIPMIWGAKALANINTPLPNANYLLTFNEPNFEAQASLTPDQAAALWPQIEQLAADQNMQIVSPAMNYCGTGCNDTNPFNWLDNFFAQCANCRVDAIAVHVYRCDPDGVMQYIQEFKARYRKPIWVTEFACLESNQPINEAVELNYMQQVVQLFENEPSIVRYAWFTGRYPTNPVINLLGNDGELTKLGQTYLSLPQTCTQNSNF